jgi:dihydroorotate dehydrogenase electron transfer subunit
MKQGIFVIEENAPIANGVMRLKMVGDTGAIIRPGQFVNIKVEGCFLRRPFSVCDWDEDSVTVVYQINGQGTKVLSSMENGEKLDVLTGLGNGFDTSLSGERPLLIGGGLGFTPLYGLAKRLVNEGKAPQVVLGFENVNNVAYKDEFISICGDITVCTRDGTEGLKGDVSVGIRDKEYTYFYTCGPEAMFKAVNDLTYTSGQFSFEQRMGCGFGACMGCSCQTLYGTKRICRDGPVLVKEEIIWPT